MKGIEGRRIVVTGGASGLGEAAVRAFVREGALVASLDVQDERGRHIVGEASAEGPGRASYYRCDVRDRAGVRAAFDDAVGDLGGLDAVVNFAGVDENAPVETMTEAQWDRMLDINLKGTFLVNQAAFPHLKAQGGRIVNVTSPSGLSAAGDHCHYSASKGGVASFSRALAGEWGPYGITVVALSPVAFTALTETYMVDMTEEEREVFRSRLARNPLGRLGDAEQDIAPVLVFLVSDAARFITGQIVAVDGGAVPVR